MAKRSEYVEYLLDLLADLGPVHARAMFGGYGIYCGGIMFGLVADDMLYLKVDDGNRDAYEARGLPPFVYDKQGKKMAMSYYQPPEEAFDDAGELCRWAEAALAAAHRARAGKSKR